MRHWSGLSGFRQLPTQVNAAACDAHLDQRGIRPALALEVGHCRAVAGAVRCATQCVVAARTRQMELPTSSAISKAPC